MFSEAEPFTENSLSETSLGVLGRQFVGRQRRACARGWRRAGGDTGA